MHFNGLLVLKRIIRNARVRFVFGGKDSCPKRLGKLLYRQTIYSALIIYIYFFFSLGSSRYIKVGCFKDKVRHRALPELLSSYRGNVHWTTPLNLSYLVEKCAEDAKKKEYMYFR